MAALTLTRCFEDQPAALERVRYFQRQLLTAEDMVTDQEYFRQKLRRHNRFLHGWGVVCGLEVTASPTQEAPWRVRIGDGYALSPQGDEIFVAEPVFLDLEQCGPGAVTDPCEPGRLHPVPGARGTLYAAIRYAECFARPVRSAVACGCDDLACEYSRVRDSFEVECLTELPPSDPAPDLCEHIRLRLLMECPPCPENPWVVLARVVLPASLEAKVTNIDNVSVRRHLYSTFVLQEQLIRCCCGPRDEPQPQPVPVRVSAVNPAEGVPFENLGPSSVSVTFDKDVQPATVNPQTVFVLRDGPPPQQVPGNLGYDPGTRTATIQFQDPVRTGEYTIVVRGVGPQHVIDVDSLALDGDNDGDEGPDFTSTFSVFKLT